MTNGMGVPDRCRLGSGHAASFWLRIRYACPRGDGSGRNKVTTTRSELDSILDELERELPLLMQDTDDPEDFLMAFTALSDAIEDTVDPEDLPYVRKRIDGMLAKHGVNLSG